MNIYFTDDSERSEDEAIAKGGRWDILVELNGDFFHLNAFHVVRLTQEFELRLEESDYYDVDPNIILVKETSKSVICDTIRYLYKKKYFDYIKPIRVDDNICYFHEYWSVDKEDLVKVMSFDTEYDSDNK